MSQPNSAYTAFLAHLHRRGTGGIKLGTERIEALLQRLGQPQRQFPCVVVAGTNGKGSTSCLIARALQRAGHRTGLFTSPHLLRFVERIQLDANPLEAGEAVRLGSHVVEMSNRHGIDASFFEICCAMACLHFAAAGADVAVFEVGLGGRLDATNVLPKHLSVITPIGLDHQHVLGHTIAAIATEKAGIIAPARPVVSARQPSAAAAVIAARARALAAPLHTVTRQTVAAASRLGHATLPPYQRVNLATAYAACAVLHAEGSVRCPTDALAWASHHFAWPGRYQLLPPAPHQVPPRPCHTLIDGGHNVDGVAALRHALATDTRLSMRRVHLIVGVRAGKNAEGMAAMLRGLAATCRTCGVTGSASDGPRQLAATFGAHAQFHADFQAAWRDLMRESPHASELIVVTGSLLLAADALACLLNQPRDPAIAG